MIIDNDTTTWQIAELMGSEADEVDGRFMMGLILSAGYSDTEEIPADEWQQMLDETLEIRAREERNAAPDDRDVREW